MPKKSRNSKKWIKKQIHPDVLWLGPDSVTEFGCSRNSLPPPPSEEEFEKMAQNADKAAAKIEEEQLNAIRRLGCITRDDKQGLIDGITADASAAEEFDGQEESTPGEDFFHDGEEFFHENENVFFMSRGAAYFFTRELPRNEAAARALRDMPPSVQEPSGLQPTHMVIFVEETEPCCVCFEPNLMVYKMGCKHPICLSCVQNWQRTQTNLYHTVNCPMCRGTIGDNPSREGVVEVPKSLRSEVEKNAKKWGRWWWRQTS